MPQATFDYQTASDDGQKDDEILDYLGRARGFDVNRALQDGHSRQDLIQYLSMHSGPDNGGGQPSPQPVSQSSGTPDDPGSPDAPFAGQPPVSLPGPGAGSPSGTGFGTAGMVLEPPPGYNQGLFQSNEFQRRAQKQFDIQAEYGARGAEAVQVAQAQIAANRAEIQQRIKDMQADGSWDKLTPRMKADVRMGAKSITPEIRPVREPGLISTNKVLAGDPYAKDYWGKPLKPDEYVRMETDYSSGAPVARYYVEPGTFTVQTYTDTQGKSWRVTYNRDHEEINREPVTDPRMLATQTSNVVFQPTKSGDTIPVVVNSTTRKVPLSGGAFPSAPVPAGGSTPPPGAPGNTPAPTPTPAPGRGGTPSGPGASVRPAGGPDLNLGKSFSPEEMQKMQTQSAQLDKTVGTIGSIQDHISLLNNLLDAKKITLAMGSNGLIQSAIARGMTLSPAERKLAADFTSMAEQINELRGPLGATGFRGQDAFGKLQALSGNLMGNPDVTREVLANTMDAFLQQRDAIRQGLNRGKPAKPGDDLVRIYNGKNPNDWGTVERKDLAKKFREGFHLLP